MRHIAWDIGIAGVAEALSKHARRATDRAALFAAGDRLQPSAGTRQVRSRCISEATTIPGNEGLRAKPPRCGARRSSIPITAASTRSSTRALREGMPTVLVSLHSFTPVYAGVARPWHIGTLYHRDTRLAAAAAEALRAERDLVVGDNEPYAVSDDTDYTIPVHGEARGLMNTGIEIRQDLIGDPAGQKAMGGPAGADFRRDRNQRLRAQGLICGLRKNRAVRRDVIGRHRREQRRATRATAIHTTPLRGSSVASDGLAGLT